jgi:hypothetical protein
LIYIYIYNCNWVDTRWQQYSSHLHTNSTQNTTYITITKFSIIILKNVHKLDTVSNGRTWLQSRFKSSYCSISTNFSAPNACFLLVPWTSGIPKLDNQHGFIISVMSLGILEFSSSCIIWESQCLEISFLQLITKTCSKFPQIRTTEMAVNDLP